MKGDNGGEGVAKGEVGIGTDAFGGRHCVAELLRDSANGLDRKGCPATRSAFVLTTPRNDPEDKVEKGDLGWMRVYRGGLVRAFVARATRDTKYCTGSGRSTDAERNKAQILQSLRSGSQVGDIMP